MPMRMPNIDKQFFYVTSVVLLENGFDNISWNVMGGIGFFQMAGRQMALRNPGNKNASSIAKLLYYRLNCNSYWINSHWKWKGGINRIGAFVLISFSSQCETKYSSSLFSMSIYERLLAFFRSKLKHLLYNKIYKLRWKHYGRLFASKIIGSIIF